jgi:hypothetical protein
MPDLRRKASVKYRSRSGPKKGQSGSAVLNCCSESGVGTAPASVWPTSVPEKLKPAIPQATKIHRGANIESSERVKLRCLCNSKPSHLPRVPEKFSSAVQGVAARLNRRTGVYDGIMAKLTGWSGVIFAGLLSSLSSDAQSLNNQILTGKYYFRHISLGTDGVNPGTLTDPRTLMGTLTFDGSGHYTSIGQLLTGINVAVPQTNSGAYSLDAGGFLVLDNALRTGARINARFSTEAIVGSSTESADNSYDLFVAIPAPAGGAVFSGPYRCMSLEFPAGVTANMRSTQFSLTQLALGNLQAFSVFGHAAGISQGRPQTQQMPGGTYAMAADGQGSITVGAASNAQLLSGSPYAVIFEFRQYRTGRLYRGRRARHRDRGQSGFRCVERHLECHLLGRGPAYRLQRSKRILGRALGTWTGKTDVEQTLQSAGRRCLRLHRHQRLFARRRWQRNRRSHPGLARRRRQGVHRRRDQPDRFGRL